MTTTRDSYGVLLSSFWDGATGQYLQSKGPVPLLLAGFLSANRFANMIGLYEVSFGKILATLTVIKGATTLRRAFEVLEASGFAFYDPKTEYVWVREMARVRLQLDGTPLKPDDKRRLGAVRLYEKLPLNPFLGPFFDRYSVELHLTHRRDGGPFRLQAPSQGALEGASQGGYQGDTEGVTDNPLKQQEYQVHQVPVQQGSDGPRTSDQGIKEQGSGKAAAPPPPAAAAVQNPEDNVEIITSLVLKDILPLGIAENELAEVTKARCAKLHIAYNSSVVRKAIDSAITRHSLVRR
jgi:hypothetical protein